MIRISPDIWIDESEIRGHLDKIVRGTVEETLDALLDEEAVQVAVSACSTVLEVTNDNSLYRHEIAGFWGRSATALHLMDLEKGDDNRGFTQIVFPRGGGKLGVTACIACSAGTVRAPLIRVVILVTRSSFVDLRLAAIEQWKQARIVTIERVIHDRIDQVGRRHRRVVRKIRCVTDEQRHCIRAILNQVGIWRYIQITICHIGSIAAEYKVTSAIC